MKLTFKMTGEEYFLGWKYKLKKGKLTENNSIKTLLLALIVLVCAVIFKFDYYMFFFIATLVVIAVLEKQTEKRAVIREFERSPILNSNHTIKLYDEGLEVINGYEKVFSPWKNVFAVQIDSTYIKILPTFRKGIIVINKDKYAGNELSEIIDTLRSNVNVEEVNKWLIGLDIHLMSRII